LYFDGRVGTSLVPQREYAQGARWRFDLNSSRLGEKFRPLRTPFRGERPEIIRADVVALG
jgi:hypothetical protein